MLKTILKYIGQLRTAEQRLLVILLLSAVIILFKLLVTSVNNDSRQDKQKIEYLQNKLDSTIRADRKELDACKDDNFRDKLDRIAELEKYNHYLDSLNEQLRKIK